MLIKRTKPSIKGIFVFLQNIMYKNGKTYYLGFYGSSTTLSTIPMYIWKYYHVVLLKIPKTPINGIMGLTILNGKRIIKNNSNVT